MKYFVVLAVLIFLGSSIALLIIYSAKIRLDHFIKMAGKALYKDPHKKIFFSSAIINQTVKILLKRRSSRPALLSLCDGNLTPALKKLPKMSQLKLEALIEPNTVLKKLEDMIKQQPQNSEILLLMADLYAWQNKDSKVRACLDNLENKKINQLNRGRQKYLQSYFDMQEGDLLAASENCSQAINIFKKQTALYEEGQAYFRLGTIYRVSALSDVAQMMLETALKIFQELGISTQQAEVLGSLGMLMVMENRREESQAYFTKSFDIFRIGDNKKGCAEIINQQALSALVGKQFAEAQNLAQEALSKHSALRNYEGEALSYELLGHIYNHSQNWEKVIDNAQKAADFYKKTHNWSAQLEADFLVANALFSNQQMSLSEKLLRQIIKNSGKHKNCFHLANAYNLLGLIFLQKGELLRAKGLFQQSLECEQKNNRLDGMAIGYANIAITEAKRGFDEQAAKTLQTAVEYAKAYGETELSAQLESKLNKMRVEP